MRRGAVVAPAVCALLLVSVAPASAHGEQQTVSPEDGSKVNSVPRKIKVDLTEPPGPGSNLKAFDGCNNRVEGPVATSGETITLTPAGGEPGRWHVEWSAISSVDGHPTKGHWIFKVSGTKDCSPDPEPTEGGDEIGGGETTRVSSPPDDDEGGGFPMVPFALGTVAVVGVAFFIRRGSGSS